MDIKGFAGRILENIVEKKQLVLLVVGVLSLPVIYFAANNKTGLFSRASSSNQNGYTIYSSDPQTGEYFDLALSPGSIKTIIDQNNIANKATVTFNVSGLRVTGKKALFGAIQKPNSNEYTQTFNLKQSPYNSYAYFESDPITLSDNPHDGCIDLHSDASRTQTNYVATFCYNIGFAHKSDNVSRFYSYNANPFFEFKYKGAKPTAILSLTTGFNKYTDGRPPTYTGKIKPTKLNGFYIDFNTSMRDFTDLTYNIQAITSGLTEAQREEICQPTASSPEIYLRYGGSVWYEGGNLINTKGYQHGCNFEIPQSSFIYGWMSLWTRNMYPQIPDTPDDNTASTTLQKVNINMFDIVTSVGTKGVPLSALAYGPKDPQNPESKLIPIFSGVTYEWGMSSLNTTGTLKPNGGIATFIPLKQGEGDIFVTARYNGKSVTSFVKVSVAKAGAPFHYEECNNNIDDDGDGLVDERCNSSITPTKIPTTPSTQKSNLGISSLVSNNWIGQDLTVKAQYVNIGPTVPIGTNVIHRLWYDNQQIYSSLLTVQPTINWKYTFNFTSSMKKITIPNDKKTHTIKTCIDVDNQLAESNEDDNCKTINFIPQLQADYPPSSSLILLWTMDDKVSGNGKTILDSTSNKRNGITEIGKNNTGMSCNDSGRIGYSCTFDGVDDRIHSTATLPFGTKSTITAWVKTSSGGAVFGSKSSPLLNTIYIRIYKGKVQGLSDLSANWPKNAVTSKKSINDDQWHHIAFVMDELNGSVYIDGVLDNTATMASKGTFTDNDWYVGYSDAGWTPNYFKGQIDNLKIYNSALTAPQIVGDMNRSTK